MAGAGRVTVSWNAVSGATSYNLLRADASDGVYQSVTLQVAGTSTVDNLLLPGYTYWYRVSANKDRALSPDSSTVSATAGTGLVLHWPLEETSGTQVEDASGGKVWGKRISGPVAIEGKIGNAVELSGQSSFASNSFLSSSQNLNRWTGRSVTLATWLKTSAVGNDDDYRRPGLLGNYYDAVSSSGDMYLGGLDQFGKLTAKYWGGTTVTSTKAINDGTWHHVAITRDESTGAIAFYVDGVAAGTGTSGSGFRQCRAFGIGRIDSSGSANWPDSYRYWPGALDEVRIYNKILTLSEIQAVFNDTGSTPGNAAPTVAITAPVPGANFVPPSSIVIQATASDSDGTVTKVEFYRGTTKLGEDASSPYAFTWSNPPDGSHQLTARATDNQGAIKDSSPVAVTVTVPLPHVGTGDGWLGRYFANKTLTEPASFERRDATIDFAWGNSSPDSRLPIDGFSVRWTGSLLAQYSETYTFTATTDDGVRVWVGGQLVVDSFIDQGPTPRNGTIALTAGQSYPIKVEYFENAGGAEARLQWSSPSTPTAIIPGTQVTAPQPGGGNAAPTVALTAPVAGAVLVAPASLTLSATASDTDGSVAKVVFYAGSTQLGEDTTSPFSVVWNLPPVGGHQLTAVATDNLGATTTSAAVAVTINAADPGTPTGNQAPTAAITSPADKASMTLPGSIVIAATASDSDGTVSKVEFFAGTAKIGEDVVAPFTLSWSEPPAGDHQFDPPPVSWTPR